MVAEFGSLAVGGDRAAWYEDALLGAVGLATTAPWFWIAGGVLIHIASIVDG